MYIARLEPIIIPSAHEDLLFHDVTKRNDLLSSKLIESKITAGLDRIKSDLGKEMLGMMQASGLLKSNM